MPKQIFNVFLGQLSLCSVYSGRCSSLKTKQNLKATARPSLRFQATGHCRVSTSGCSTCAWALTRFVNIFRVGGVLSEPEVAIEATFLGSDNAEKSVNR